MWHAFIHTGRIIYFLCGLIPQLGDISDGHIVVEPVAVETLDVINYAVRLLLNDFDKRITAPARLEKQAHCCQCISVMVRLFSVSLPVARQIGTD